MSEKITIISPLHINNTLKRSLKQIAALPEIKKVICLPDIHQKKRTEGPSSLASVAEGVIIPTLTSPSLNCGMAVLKTDLKQEELTQENIKKTLSYFKSFTGKEYSYGNRLLIWLGVKKRTYNKYDLTKDELENIICSGSKVILDKYGLPESTCARQEDKGNFSSAVTITKQDLKKLLPRSSYTSGLHNLGTNFKGNHFLEFQKVEDIYNSEKADQLGIKKGNIMIMYHGGGGAIAHQMGRYYANRKKNTPRERIQLFLGKIFLHFATIDGLRSFPVRWKYYFNPDYYQAVPVATDEGQRLLKSIKAAMNYGFAYRLATIARLRDAFRQTLGRKVALELVQNISHNNITEEVIDGKKVYVHRHNVCQVRPQRIQLLPGDKYTNSYLLDGLEGAAPYAFSVDHGAGETARLYKEKNMCQPLNTYTLKFDKLLNVEKVRHYSSEGVDEVVRQLEKHGIAKPFIKLKPIAVFKG